MNVPELRECPCPVPEPHPNPRKGATCVRCGYVLGPTWASGDATLAEFLDRFEDTFPVVPDWWHDVRLHVEARERAGRKQFRQTFLGRNNLHECREEIIDGILYVWLDTLVGRRAGADEETDVVLEIVNHFAQAYRGLAQLKAKHHGAP